MSRSPASARIGVFTLAVVLGIFFVPAHSIKAERAHVASLPKPSGITQHSIELARASSVPSQSVTMAPQSSLKLLAHATQLGPHAATSPIRLTLALKLRNTARLKSFLEQVQNPASHVFRQWLTPAEFTRLYGPTQADVNRVVEYLQQRGIKILSISANRTLIRTQAPTTVYEQALSIRIHDYRLDNRHFYSTADRPRLGHEIAPLVASILGLDHGVQLRPVSLHQKRVPAARALGPRQAPPASLTQLNPLQIARAYNYPDITDASHAQGVQIAIPTANSSGLAQLSDPHDFWAAFGLPDHRINIIEVGGDKSNTSGMDETLLDIEYAGAMGPGATLNVYVAADATTDLFTETYNRLVNDTHPDGTPRNQVMTTSWGSIETQGSAAKIAQEQIFMQAAAEGISMFAAVGDHGTSDGTNMNNVAIYPSSSIYMTSANGTQLSIANLAGDYGGEIVWDDADCFGNGSGATGGAISRLFAKPDWQAGAGVPTDIHMRMNSDLAATASCSRPMWVLVNGQWQVTAGTSAVAPQFAGIFAIAVAATGAPLGLSNTLIYQSADKYYGSDFRDVTSGCNGQLPDGSPSCATAAWDHPTGWGSPNVLNFLSHISIPSPRGTLKGTITAAATGSAIAGAKVVALANNGTRYVAITQRDGAYSRVLPAGDFTVTASDFGYADGNASVSVSEGATIIRDFALDEAPKATLSGTVNDASGHGYGLFAHIKVSAVGIGHVTDLWTDPANGTYSVRLPIGATYTLNVTAAFNGYDSGSQTVSLSGDTRKDIPLAVTRSCSAPGYQYVTGGFGEDFNGPAFPPPGWRVTHDVAGSPIVWKLNTDWGQENWTGGNGTAATIAGTGTPPYRGAIDSSLVTPPIPVQSLGGATTLTYRANVITLAAPDTLDLDISTDGGGNWANLLRWSGDHGTFQGLPGENVRVELAQYLPANGSFQLRWHKYAGNRGFYTQIDDVAMGRCEPVAGGIVFGSVTDASNGAGVTGAQVSDDTGANTTTTTADFNPNPPSDGFYMYFAQAGDRSLHASKPLYGSATAQITIANNVVVEQNFTLKSMQFATDPQALTAHVKVNNTATASLALHNTGAGAGPFRILAINAPPPGTAHPMPRSESVSPAQKSWVSRADYPFAVGDNLAAYDAETGKVYSISGASDGHSTEPASYAYDPKTDSWSLIAAIPVARAQTAGAFIDGKLYVAGGEAARGVVTNLDIYAPLTDSWSSGAGLFSPVRAATAVVLNDKLYLIGGQGSDGDYLSRVEVYDPLTDGWSMARDYPHAVKAVACGTIDGKIYCAGGANQTGGNYADGYVYEPASDSWSPIADLPIADGVSDAAHGAASGQLVLAGGYIGAVPEATHQVEAYDPVTNAWYSLPNTHDPVARGGGSCANDGFYTVGSYSIRGLAYSEKVQKLPGYVCGAGGIPWLTLVPDQGRLTAGAVTRVEFSLDSSGHAAFTTSQAYLKILGSPNPVIIPVTVHWEPQPVNLDVSGNVNPVGVVHKGDNLTYNITVQNLPDAEGSASETRLVYQIPQGMNYLASNGARCTLSVSSSNVPAAAGGMPIAASVAGPAKVACGVGTLEPNAGKLVTIAVRATAAATSVSASFAVSSREPDSDPTNNSLTVDTNPAVGPPGPKGDTGNGSLAFAAITMLGMLILAVGAVKTRKRRS